MLNLFLENLQTLLTPTMLVLMFGTAVLGLIFGTLPGLNATMAVALLLPMTFLLTPQTGIALLVVAFVAGISGGLVSAILLRIPGTPSSIATTFDGYPLAQKGQAVKALSTGIIASFVGGLISLLILTSFAPLIARIAIQFGPFEYAALAILALAMVGILSRGSTLKGLLAALLGLFLSTIGFAPIGGAERFTMGNYNLAAGINTLAFLVGLFAISQLINEMLSRHERAKVQVGKQHGATLREVRSNFYNMGRSSLIGAGIGVLPGIGGSVSNLIAYAVARKSSKTPEKFGTGHVDGVYASESANNASIGAALLPLITLGIPGDGVTAMLLGGFQIHGLQPGPLMFRESPEIVASVYAALFLAILMVFVVQLSTIRIFPLVFRIPRHYLIPILLVMTAIGTYVQNYLVFDLWIMLGIGLIGFALERYRFPLAPVVLGFVLGPILEENLRRGLVMSEGSLSPFVTDPISAVCLAVLAAFVFLPWVRKRFGARASLS